jgi:hypothetical protein
MESEIKITKDELRKLSIEFRTVAGRLIRTHPDEGMKNLKRFMNFIENNIIIQDFIQKHNSQSIDIQSLLSTDVYFVGEYHIPDDSQEEEIAFVYQLLKYGLEKYYPHSQGYDYLSQSLFGYQGKTKDRVERFNFSVVKPFVNYIENHLTHLQIDMGDAEQAKISIQVYGNNYGDNLGVGGTMGETNINQSNSSIGVGVNQGEIKAEKLAGTINEKQKQNLVEAAAEIRQLLNQLEQSYPTRTLIEKATVADVAIQRIDANPTLKGRVIGALKSAGAEAFKEAVDHPLVNILMAGIEGWQQGN